MRQIETVIELRRDDDAAYRAMLEHMSVHHWACVACEDVSEDFASSVLSQWAAPLDVYGDGQTWSSLTVRLDAAANRTHGIGENPLHVDYVNRSAPPRWIVLRGVRMDPMGGGDSVISNMREAATALSSAHKHLLRQPVFRYWNDEGAIDVGDPLSCFSVLPTFDAWTRFTAKMIPHIDGSDDVLTEDGRRQHGPLLEAMRIYRDVLVGRALCRRLRPGELLIFDQQYFAHGRLAMGDGQANLKAESRRLLQQAYCRQHEQ